MSEFFQTSFQKDAWRPDDWQMVRSMRWDVCSRWIQKQDHIENDMPDDIRPEDMQMGRDRTGETYVSMLARQGLTWNTLIRTTCSFDDRMAPLLVIAKELTDVYKAHWEIVLYDHGVNIWRYDLIGGKLHWYLEAFLEMNLAPKIPHVLEAIPYRNSKGDFLFAGCNGQYVGCRLGKGMFPDSYHAGITACEGKNRFYDFSTSKLETLPTPLAERFTD